jgi:hypothetical protein
MKPAQRDRLRGHELTELVEIRIAALELPPHGFGELGRGPLELHVDEAPVEVQAEVPLQRGRRVLGREDHRDLDAEIDPVRALEDQLVGEVKLCGREPLLLHVHAAAERTVVVHERAAEQVRGVERPELERKERRAVLLLPEARWEHGAHHEVHELLVLGDHRHVVDDRGKLGRLA